MTFDEIIEKYREVATSKENLETRFEVLMRAYLPTVPMYSSVFSDVWLWNNFLGKDYLGGHDTAIDLVAQNKEGEYWAILCKCFVPKHNINKDSIDFFISTTGRQLIYRKALGSVSFTVSDSAFSHRSM